MGRFCVEGKLAFQRIIFDEKKMAARKQVFKWPTAL